MGKIIACLVLGAVLLTATADPKMKKPPLPSRRLSGLYSMKYMPLIPYTILGLNPLLYYGPIMNPNPRVVKELPKAELPAPYAPPYGDMDKIMGYGGLAMPYGGYGYPFLRGYKKEE